ncbi:hypothetical protein ACRRTK_020841 [Alexandromys fortis]
MDWLNLKKANLKRKGKEGGISNHRGQGKSRVGGRPRRRLTLLLLPRKKATARARAERLSLSLRCSAASLVSWESEMKHCSSGREKLFCSRLRDLVSVDTVG